MSKRNIQWDYDAWQDYLYWQTHDKTIIKKINSLIEAALRDPYDGIGQPEGLKGNLSGFWSRRINGEHRFVYAVEEKTIVIIACKSHYE